MRLIDTAKPFVTKPVSCKHPRKRPVKATESGGEPKAFGCASRYDYEQA